MLTDILRDEWGFEGFTISDFIFGVRDGVKAIQAGLDVEMPLPVQYKQNLLKAVEDGRVPESLIDRAVLRVLRTLLVFENTPEKMAYTADLVACPGAHQAGARGGGEVDGAGQERGRRAAVQEGPRKVLVLGRLAAQENTGDHGSSRIYAPYVITPLEGLKKYFGEGVEITHLDETQIARAKELAPGVDCVIMVVGNDFNDEGEFVSPGGMSEFMTPVIQGSRIWASRSRLLS